jgi:uncharacterized protein
MKIFDFNIHLPDIKDEDVNVVIQQDMNLTTEGVFRAFEIHEPFISNVEGCNVLLFNPRLLDGHTVDTFFSKTSSFRQKGAFTTIIDFRRADIAEYLQMVKNAGIKGIIFNSYLQEIADSDFASVLNACKIAAGLGLFICIDGSYGTSKMYTYDNMKLACFIADNITSVPIVIIHSGGYRILEAMLLAADKKNVWLDTSFSLPYYIGSSIEQDYAFAYKRIGTHRVMYGSDYPYDNSDNAIKIHLDFFRKHNFTESEIEHIFFNNATNFPGFE